MPVSGKAAIQLQRIFRGGHHSSRRYSTPAREKRITIFDIDNRMNLSQLLSIIIGM